jgi:hypothetical protein
MRGALGAAGQCTLRQMQHAAAHVSTQAKAAAASVARGCGAAPSIIASPRGWAAPRPVVIRATARKIPHPNATAAAVARPVPPRCRLLRSRTRQALSVTEPEPRCLLPHSSAGSVTHRTRRTLTRQAGATTSLSTTRPPGWDINVHEQQWCATRARFRIMPFLVPQTGTSSHKSETFPRMSGTDFVRGAATVTAAQPPGESRE